MSTSKAVVELGSLKDGLHRIISIKYDNKFEYYTIKYDDGENVHSYAMSKRQKQINQEILELLYSAKFYDDCIIVCFKTDINRMFKIKRTKYMSFNEFLTTHKELLCLFSQGCRFIKLISSIKQDSIIDVDTFVKSVGMEYYMPNSNGSIGSKYSSVWRAYSRFKFVRKVLSELQKNRILQI